MSHTTALPTSNPWRAVGDIDIAMADVDHVEGIAVAPDGSLWAGGDAGQIYRATDGDTWEIIATLPGRTLGIAFDGGGSAYCCDMTDPGVYRVSPTGEVSLYSRGDEARPFRVPNYPAFLPDGTLLVSDSGDWEEPNGTIQAIDPGGSARVLSDLPSSFPNGLCVSADGRTVYVCETTASRISVLHLDAASVVHFETVLELPGALPDGVALDADGRLYIACYVPDAIFVLGLDGSLELVIQDPRRILLNEPTNIAFGGPSMTDLYFANLGDRHVGRLHLGVAGLAPHRPNLA
ncbi:MAG: SMP-30/gluconolactonase/LRE family protein [Chloroflexi bacterium]|nr:SMP-30/gluconolactonase/LRE family protein [Chloroflexota bacterium]